MKVDGQLDLFSASANSLAPGPPGAETLRRIAWGMLDDDSLVTSFAHAGMRDSLALAAEAGRRRLALAIPALEALCRRFVGLVLIGSYPNRLPPSMRSP